MLPVELEFQEDPAELDSLKDLLAATLQILTKQYQVVRVVPEVQEDPVVPAESEVQQDLAGGHVQDIP